MKSIRQRRQTRDDDECCSRGGGWGGGGRENKQQQRGRACAKRIQDQKTKKRNALEECGFQAHDSSAATTVSLLLLLLCMADLVSPHPPDEANARAFEPYIVFFVLQLFAVYS